MEKRCIVCNRLLFIENDGVKQIKTDNIEYRFSGMVHIICKCGKVNKF